MAVPDADLPLIAVVMQQLKSPAVKWSMVPSARFAGPAASAVPSRWLQSSSGLAGVSFAADIDVFLDGADDEQEARVPQRPAATPGDGDNADAGPDPRTFHSAPTAPVQSWLVEPGGNNDEHWSRQGVGPEMARSQSEGPAQTQAGVLELAMLGLRAVQGMRGPSQCSATQGTFSSGAGTPAARGGQYWAHRQEPALGNLHGVPFMNGVRPGYPIRDRQETEQGDDGRFPPTVGSFERAREESRPDSSRFPQPVGTVASSYRLEDRLAQHRPSFPSPVGSISRSRLLAEGFPLEENLPSPQAGRTEIGEQDGSSTSTSYTLAQEEAEEEFKEVQRWGDVQRWGGVAPPGAVPGPVAPPPAPVGSGVLSFLGGMLRSRSMDTRERSDEASDSGYLMRGRSDRSQRRRLSAMEDGSRVSSASLAARRASIPEATKKEGPDNARHRLEQRPDESEMADAKREPREAVEAKEAKAKVALQTGTNRRAGRSLFSGGAPERMVRSASSRTASTSLVQYSVRRPAVGDAPPPPALVAAAVRLAAGIDPSVQDEVMDQGQERAAARHRSSILGFKLMKKKRKGALSAGAVGFIPRDDAVARLYVDEPEAQRSSTMPPAAKASTVSKVTLEESDRAELESTGSSRESTRKRSPPTWVGGERSGGGGAPLLQVTPQGGQPPHLSVSKPRAETPAARSSDHVVVTTAVQQGVSIPDAPPLPASRRISTSLRARETLPVWSPLPGRRVSSPSARVLLPPPPSSVAGVVSVAMPTPPGMAAAEDYGAEEAEEEEDDSLPYATGAALGPTAFREKDADMEGYTNMPEDALNSLVLQDSLPLPEPTRPPREVSRPAPLTPTRGSIGGPEGTGPEPAERSIAAPRDPFAALRDPTAHAQNQPRPAPDVRGNPAEVVGRYYGGQGGAGGARADPVCFSCFSPPTVSEGQAFPLKVSAYLTQQRDSVLQEALKEGVKEAGVPGAMRIMRGRRVTVKLVSEFGVVFKGA